MEIKYKFEIVMIASGLFMLLTMYEMPVNSYFKVIKQTFIRILFYEILNSV